MGMCPVVTGDMDVGVLEFVKPQAPSSQHSSETTADLYPEEALNTLTSRLELVNLAC